MYHFNTKPYPKKSRYDQPAENIIY